MWAEKPCLRHHSDIFTTLLFVLTLLFSHHSTIIFKIMWPWTDAHYRSLNDVGGETMPVTTVTLHYYTTFQQMLTFFSSSFLFPNSKIKHHFRSQIYSKIEHFEYIIYYIDTEVMWFILCEKVWPRWSQGQFGVADLTSTLELASKSTK